MATAAHRARDRGASGDRRRLSESGRDRSASAGRLGTASTGKTGQRDRGDHRVGRGKTGQHGQPQPQPRKPFFEGKNKSTAKPANESEVITGFGVELSASEHQPPPLVPSTSLCEPFRDAVELGLSQGRNAMAIWQDLVSESGFRGGYQT